VVAYTFDHAFLYIENAGVAQSTLFKWAPDTEGAFRMLQLVQPESWHDDVYVFGNTTGLESLGKACLKAAKSGLTQTFSASPSDFETADVNVVPVSIDTADAALPSAYGQNPHCVMHLFSKQQGTLAYKTAYPRLLPYEMLEWVQYREAMLGGKTAKLPPVAVVPELEDDAKKWLAIGEQGLSSAFIFWKITRVAPKCLANRFVGIEYYPLDSSDFKRCRLLLEEVPSVATHFRSVMGMDAGPVWGRLVAYWDTLCTTMDAESPNWRTSRASANKTYAMLKTIIAETRPSCET
jgi:hypothetical protein